MNYNNYMYVAAILTVFALGVFNLYCIFYNDQLNGKILKFKRRRRR